MPRLHLPHARPRLCLMVATLWLLLPATGCVQIKNSYDNATPVELSEWSITAEDGGSLPTFKPGRVALRVHNAGKGAHELIFLKTDKEPTELPLRNGRIDEKAAGRVYGAVQVPVSGDTQNTAVQLRPGKYVFFCNITGHFISGMYTTAVVR